MKQDARPTKPPKKGRPPAAGMMPGKRMAGTLVTVKTDAGYGFISPGQGLPHVFVRIAMVPPELWREGARLVFSVHPPQSGRSWFANDVEAEPLEKSSHNGVSEAQPQP